MSHYEQANLLTDFATGEVVYVCVWKLKGFLAAPVSGALMPPSMFGDAWLLTVVPSIVGEFILAVIDPKRCGKPSVIGDRELGSYINGGLTP